MGLQVRKRTKGKNSWWNGSYSKKGAGASGSVKLSDNVTWNTGDLVNGKTNKRLTINFGNGYRYVWYGKKTKPSQSQPEQYDLRTTKLGRVLLYILIVGIIIYIAGT